MPTKTPLVTDYADEDLAEGQLAEVDSLAHDDLGLMVEHCFGYDNNYHHEEWYAILENKAKQVDPDNPLSAVVLTRPDEQVNNKQIIIEAPRDHSKSTCFSVNYALFEIGRNPNIRIVLASNAQDTSELFLREITTNIETNEDYQRVYGMLKPNNAEKWTDREIIVNRSMRSKDPTVVATSIGGQVIAKRADIIICDDLLTLQNTRTAVQREFVKEWFLTVLIPVLTPGGRLIVVGTPWNLMDLYQQLLKDPTFQVRKRYDAIVDEEKKVTLWDRWGWDYLMERKQLMGATAFNRSYRTMVTNPDEAVFREEWLEAAKKRGKDVCMQRSFNYAKWTRGPVVIGSGTDLAISKKDDADETAFAIVAKMMKAQSTVDNSGKQVSQSGMKMPLFTEAGKFSPAQTRARFVEHFENFKPQVMMVENNAYQESIRRDMADQTDIPIRGYTTGGEKFDPEIGINSLAVEFENGKWILPYGDEYSRRMTDRLVDAMLVFPQGHTDDILMALDVDTDIWTSCGWKKLEDVCVGDVVATPSGDLTKVVHATDINTEPVWKVKLWDGSELRASAAHRWWVQESRNQNAPYKWMTTQQLLDSPWNHGSNKHIRLEKPSPIKLRKQRLPIDPYVLGVWLGDGDSRQGTIFQASGDIPDLIRLINNAGYKTEKHKHQTRFGIHGIRGLLSGLGVLGNKHVPDKYLLGSVEQRLALLQGLMDTDGTIRPDYPKAYFGNTNKQVVDSVEFLLLSLGFRPNVQYRPAGEYPATDVVKGGQSKPFWRVLFDVTEGMPVPFRIPRKAKRCGKPTRGSRLTTIKSIEPDGETPVRCLMVEHPSHQFLAGKRMMPTGNSLWFANTGIRDISNSSQGSMRVKQHPLYRRRL